jgi:acetyl-CoA C-acetyltransferase
MSREAYIVSIARTPMGSFMGSLAGISATKLGAIAVKEAVKRAGIDPASVQELYMGNVLQASLGQAPATQVAIYAGLGSHVPCTTINKVCASGSKAIMLAAQNVICGDADIVVAGGMENMSSVPFYLDKARSGYKYGNGVLVDGLQKDGLWDVYNDFAMGNCAELCAKEMKISREEQDAFAVMSYKRAAIAYAAGNFNPELVPVEVNKGKEVINIIADEDYSKVNFEKIPTLKPVFIKDGTVTAANASTMNDGASALVIMSGDKVAELGLKPLARIVAYADAAQAPEWFTTTPSLAVPKALHKAGIDIKDVDLFELNEAFAVVGLANIAKLEIDPAKVNIWGGAVALGHPLGSSGSRIVCTLVNQLIQTGKKIGVTGICNGGGGASAIVVERVSSLT